MSGRPFIASERTPMDSAGGKNQSRWPSTGLVSARNFSANARAAAGPWFIFQLAANMSLRSVIAPTHPEHARDLSVMCLKPHPAPLHPATLSPPEIRETLH